jgi:hypothetical protein
VAPKVSLGRLRGFATGVIALLLLALVALLVLSAINR